MTLDGIDEATLNKILTLIELQFGSKCEVVLHDLTKPYDHTIVDIRNGYITGRKVGDCGSNLGLEVMRGHCQKWRSVQLHYPYERWQNPSFFQYLLL